MEVGGGAGSEAGGRGRAGGEGQHPVREWESKGRQVYAPIARLCKISKIHGGRERGFPGALLPAPCTVNPTSLWASYLLAGTHQAGQHL